MGGSGISCQQTLLYQIFRFLELHLLTSPLMISCVQKVHKQGSLGTLNGWRILYTDSENDMMVVSDDPWQYNYTVIHEVKVENVNDDNKSSFLKQAAPMIETSKSSSVSQPDSPQRSLGLKVFYANVWVFFSPED
ncbi:hypothetical protein HID58_045833 [Brassica napus]|uniref:Auxin-responsive protein n=1 Tax=Brassica napus TaxID=3708 RepID=A0ABQ8AUP6_BRANA|nr:hypothetical protein HID58_045833 [Brassica napus]